MNEADRAVRRIKRGGLLFSVLLISCIAAAAAFLPFPVYVKAILLPIAAFFALGIRGNILLRRVGRIVEEELDPVRYHYVMHKAGLASENAFTDIATACATGDYGSAIGLCNRKLEGCKRESARLPYLLYLAACFFDLEDAENLGRVCADLERLLQDPKRGKQYERACGTVLRYYVAYLKGDFAACKAHREEWRARPEKEKSRFARYRTEYMYAMACLKNGEADAAAKSFSEVASACPLLYIGHLSGARLQAMANGEAYRVQPVPPCSQFPVVQPEHAPNRRSGLKVIVFLVAVALLAVSLGFLFSRSRGTPQDVLAYADGCIEVYATVPVNAEGDVLCVYAREGDFYIGSEDWEGHTEPPVLCVAYLESVGEDTYTHGVSVDVRTVSPNVIYEIYAGSADLHLAFVVVENLSDIPSGAQVTELVHNGKTYYFCLTEVLFERCFGYRTVYTNHIPDFGITP